MRERRRGGGRLGAAAAALCLGGAVPAATAPLEPVCHVIAQADAPVAIDGYTCQYREGAGREGGIRHQIRYRNNAARRTVAVQLGMVSFDAFDDLIAASRGATLESTVVGDHGEVSFLQGRGAEFAFHTGVVYVAKVRFDDGTVWRADLRKVAEWLRRIQATFDPAELERKPAPASERSEP